MQEEATEFASGFRRMEVRRLSRVSNDNDSGLSALSLKSLTEGIQNIVEQSRDPTKTAREASFFSCYCNLINSIMGAGILGLPYAFANTGWVFGENNRDRWKIHF